MDPLSVLSAVSAATKTTYNISSTLFRFIQSTRVIDKSLEELNREVESLTKALEAIELSLKDPAIIRIKNGEGTKGPWGSLDVAVTDTQRTVNALERIVEGLGTVKRSANPFKKAVKQVELNLDADQITRVKDRIRTHTTSLQLALQTASLLIGCQSSEGIQRVERLIKHHQKVPGTTGKEASTNYKRDSSAKQSGSGPIHGPPAPILAESMFVRIRSAALQRDTSFVKRNAADIKGRHGAIALEGLAGNGNKTAVKWLLDHGAKTEGGTNESALVTAASEGHKSMINYLLDRGAKIDAGAGCGTPALVEAALEGHTSIVECLLARGANIEAKSWDGDTALLEAASENHKSIVKCLLDHGANIEAKDDVGNTALICAAGRENNSIVKYLLDRGANIEGKGPGGSTALSEAAATGHVSTVRCLLDRGADIDATNSSGQTALLLACQCANNIGREIGPAISLLCFAGADVSVQGYLGRSPLRHAREIKDSQLREEVIRVLKRYGAKM